MSEPQTAYISETDKMAEALQEIEERITEAHRMSDELVNVAETLPRADHRSENRRSLLQAVRSLRASLESVEALTWSAGEEVRDYASYR